MAGAIPSARVTMLYEVPGALDPSLAMLDRMPLLVIALVDVEIGVVAITVTAVHARVPAVLVRVANMLAHMAVGLAHVTIMSATADVTVRDPVLDDRDPRWTDEDRVPDRCDAVGGDAPDLVLEARLEVVPRLRATGADEERDRESGRDAASDRPGISIHPTRFRLVPILHDHVVLPARVDLLLVRVCEFRREADEFIHASKTK